MSTYTTTTNFAAKDSLPSGSSDKIVRGSEFTQEFNNIATAINDTDSKTNINASAIESLETSVASNASDITTLQNDKAPLASPTFTGTSTFSDVNLVDGATLSLGADDDLRLFHNGVHSHMYDRGTGNLYIGSNGNGIGLQTVDANGASNGTLANFNNGGSCQLFHNNDKKFQTNEFGVEVIGLTATTTLAVTTEAAFTDLTVIGSDERRADGNLGFTYISFKNQDATATYGNIYHASGTLTYSTSSDYRLKENIVTLEGACERVKQLPVKRFNFTGFDRTVDGFLAHEVQDIVPEAVVGDKDAVDEDGAPVYQAIDQSKLVPLLTAALQEALERIEILETTVNGGGE